MSVTVQPKKGALSAEALRKQIYRQKLKDQLGEDEYKKQQALKKKEYRAKLKLNKSPQQQQQQVVEKVVQQVVQNVAPAIVKKVESETKGKITNFFKPITKDQFLKNIKNEPIRDLIKEIKTTVKKHDIVSDKIDEEIKTITGKKNVSSIKPLHVKYDGKTANKSTNTQYLSKLRTVYKLLFDTNIDESIITELQKLLDGKVYNQGIINHIQFFRNINKIIDVIKKKYTNKNTLSTYINAITSILSRVREYFPTQYDKIAQLNIDMSKQYQRGRDTNDAPDKVINNLISFDDEYINKLVSGITNISDKALVAVYTIAPPRRIKDYQLMKLTNKKDFDKLDPKYNYIMFENNKPSLFAFFNHKTSGSYPETKINIPDQLANILKTYIDSNSLNNNDYLFGRDRTDYKQHYSQPKFTELLQKTFLKYTGKKISVDLIRASKSTHLDNQNISLAQRKQIAQDMGHSLLTNLQYSLNMGVERLNAQPTTTPATVTPPTKRKNAPRSTTKNVNYDETS